MGRPRERPRPGENSNDQRQYVNENLRRFLKQSCITCDAKINMPCVNMQWIEEGSPEGRKRKRRPTYQSYVHAARRS